MPNVSGIDHAIGYAALARGAIEIKDAYSTDAKIQENDLVVLRDDRHFFPEYQAVFLYRLTLDPRAVGALNHFGRIDETKMIALNAAAERSKDYAYAASLYFHPATNEGAPRRDLWPKLARWTGRHLELASISLLLSVLVGLPLGIVASRGGPVGQAILAVVGMIQTIPSLALSRCSCPCLFSGSVRRLRLSRSSSTACSHRAEHSDRFAEYPAGFARFCHGLGLEPGARLRKIYLPLASRTILAGIKTSAVINIGTATLAALIGAGGLGEPILSGLNLNDHTPFSKAPSRRRSLRFSCRDYSTCSTVF